MNEFGNINLIKEKTSPGNWSSKIKSPKRDVKVQLKLYYLKKRKHLHSVKVKVISGLNQGASLPLSGHQQSH